MTTALNALKRVTDKKSKQENFFVVGKSGARNFERKLRDLCELGYLSTPLDKPDNTWDEKSINALKEFLELHNYATEEYAVDKKVLEDIEDTWKKNSFSLVVLNAVPNSDKPHSGLREIGIRQKSGEGRYYIGLFESIYLRLQREVADQQEFTVDLVIPSKDPSNEELLLTKKFISDKTLFNMELGYPSQDMSYARIGSFTQTTPALLRCSRVHPKYTNKRLMSEIPVNILLLGNLAYITDDGGKEFLLSQRAYPKIIELKKQVNERGGKLYFASTLRTASDQFKLWLRYKKGIQLAPANQPGSSVHETGHAIDISVWALNLVEWENYGFKVKPEKRDLDGKVDTEEENKIGLYFFDNLEEFRKLAYQLNFEPAGKRWEKIAWNKGYGRIRREAFIVDAQYPEEIKKFTFWFKILETSPKEMLHTKRIGNNYQAKLTIERPLSEGFTGKRQYFINKKILDRKLSSIPLRCYDESGRIKPNKRVSEEMHLISWTINADAFAESEREIDFYRRNIDGILAEFFWKEGRTEFAIWAQCVNVEETGDLLYIEGELRDSEFNPESAVLVNDYFYIKDNKGNEKLMRPIYMGDMNYDEHVSSTKRFVIKLPSRSLTRMLGQIKRADDLNGTNLQVVTENQTEKPVPGWWRKTDTPVFRAESPAFYPEQTEKHHYQVPLPPPTNDEKNFVDKLVVELDEIVDEHNTELDVMINKVENSNISNIEKQNIKKNINGFRWLKYGNNKYYKTVLMGAAYIGNLPIPSLIKTELEQLRKEELINKYGW